MKKGRFQVGDKAVWEQFRWEGKASIYSNVTIIGATDGTYIIQFDGTVTTKRVTKDSKWLRQRVK